MYRSRVLGRVRRVWNHSERASSWEKQGWLWVSFVPQSSSRIHVPVYINFCPPPPMLPTHTNPLPSPTRTQTTLLFAQCVYLMFAGVYKLSIIFSFLQDQDTGMGTEHWHYTVGTGPGKSDNLYQTFRQSLPLVHVVSYFGIPEELGVGRLALSIATCEC
jgi:hypothetical protein